ncbi:unnamed protein product, partial [Effrenium voratum]
MRLCRSLQWCGYQDARPGLSRRPQMPHQGLVAGLLREAAEVTRSLSSFPGLPDIEPLVCIPLAALAKSVGAIASPFEAYLALRGMKTLAVRMERQCSNAQRVAEFLEKHPQVTEVHYPGLTSHPQHELCMRQMRSGGAVVTVRLKGSADSESDLELMRRFFGRLQIWVLAESLGGVESMINHSATMSHGSMTKEQRAEVGVYDTTLRLSVGLE